MPSAAALDLIINLKDKASDGLDSLSDTVGGFGKVLGLAGVGVVAFGGFLTGAAKAAADEEVGMKRLGATLKANIPNFDGNEAAAEGFVSQMEKLAFTDDEARDSLNKLIPRTHDLAKAQDLATIAADLARAKNIDLSTATDIVGKVYGGNVGILGRYGIAVDKGASSTEALAAIQTMAAGQAQAYADSSAGSIDRIQTAFGDAFETIGHSVLDVVSGPLTDFADWLQTPEVQTGIQTVADAIGVGLTNAFNFLKGALDVVGPPLAAIAQKVGEFFAVVASGDKDAVLNFFNDIGGPIGFVGTLLTNLVDGVGKFFQAVLAGDGESVKTFFSDLGGGPDSLIGQGGAQLQEFINEVGDLWAALNGGGSAEAKQFWIDLEAVMSRIQDSWDNFWAPQSQHTIKNKEEWADLQLNGDPQKNGFDANWATFWTNTQNGISEMVNGWNKFWDDTRSFLGITQADWDKFWGGQKTNQTEQQTLANGFHYSELTFSKDLTDNWNRFWDTTKASFTDFDTKWRGFWTTMGTGLGVFMEGWTNFWTDVGKLLGNFGLAWNNFWSSVGTSTNNFRAGWDSFWSSVGSALSNFGTNWDTFWANLWSKITGIIDGASNIGSDIVDGIKQGITNAWNGLVTFVRGLLDSLLATISGVVGAIPGGGGNAPIVAGGHGGRGAIGFGGGGGGGVLIGNVNIYATPGTDGARVASDFIDGLSEQLGVTVRLRNPTTVHP